MTTKLWSNGQIDFVLLIYAAVFVNALIFVLLVSNPLLTADAWYFVDVFVRHAYDGALGLGDFFVQRVGLDHAQPLRKLILLMELKWFRLSLLPEAVIGLFCAGLCAYLLYRLIQQEVEKNGWHVETRLMWLVTGCALISLNSTGIWTWPLVALSYSSLIFVFWFFIAVWQALDAGRHAGLIISSLLLAIVSDDTAILVGAAALLAVLGFAWKKSLRQGWWRVPIVFAVILGTSQTLINIFGPAIGGEDLPRRGLGHIVQLVLHEGWWRWPVYALSNSVVSRDTLRWLDADHVLRWQIVLAAVLAGMHLWFWWRFVRTRINGPAFVAVCMMLLFYASVAGIVYGRVGVFGSEYLNQPRYVLFYQLNLVALALMYVGGWEPRATSAPRAWRKLKPGIGFALVFLVFQVVFAKHAWHTAPYIRLYYWKMADQISAMAQHPDVTPAECVPELPLCDMPPAQRAELLALLRKHNLNLFNDKFRLMHGFQPQL